ncbi:MAG: M15 family metallopeptidase [Pseudomonadales bacterium]|nr:M15 family metallopeptidase [Pseudomonadales bacterium]
MTAADDGVDAAGETREPMTEDTKFGHFAFAETSAALGDAGGYRDTGRVVQLRTEAADAFVAMQAAAQDVGVHLVPISGYRTVGYQDGLFGRAIDRYGTPEEAAVWVAPPGYSEHHTGLAIDIGDLDHPEADVEVSFEATPAFDWLKNNADRFGFELSFPDGNPQGVSYEPWHWRFIGELATP